MTHPPGKTNFSSGSAVVQEYLSGRVPSHRDRLTPHPLFYLVRIITRMFVGVSVWWCMDVRVLQLKWGRVKQEQVQHFDGAIC